MVIKTTPGFFGFSSKHRKKRNSKKAQIKVKQMVFMLIAVTMLFTMIGLFVITLRANSLKNSASGLEEENARLLIAKLANSPEFSCGEAFGSSSNCVDFDKVMALKNNSERYEDLWGVSQIELRIIHSFEGYSGTEKECEYDFQTREGNYPDCNYVRIMNVSSMGNDFSSYVSVCKRKIINAEGDAQTVCNLGKLIVRYQDVKL